MERNIQKIGAINFLILLVAGVVSYALGRFSLSWSGQVGAVFLGLGFLVALVSYVQMALEEKERLEQLEYDEINRDKNSASLFTAESETFPARRAREQFERFFLPAFTVILFILQGGAAFMLWRWLDKAIITAPRQGMVALALFSVLALILFLLGKYSANIARFENQRLIRPSSSFLVWGAYMAGAVAIAIGLVYGGAAKADFYLARAFVVLLGLAALESLLNLILEIYRPRVRGKKQRLVYESRLFGLLSQPEGIFSTAAHALDYQFGFKVSETWFYRFLEKALAWLILLQFIVLVISSSFVFIGPGEEALLERFGNPSESRGVLRPGVHLKMPWPIDKIYRFRTDEIQTFHIGSAPDRGHGTTITWRVSHDDEPMNLMVAAREVRSGDTNELGGLQADILTVGIPVQYQISDVRKYAYNHVDSGALLKSIATREVVKFLLGVDLVEILSTGKGAAAAALQQAIQAEADRLNLGVKLVLVGLEDIHPPVGKVVDAFEAVVGAVQEKEAKIRQAEGYAASTVSLAQGQAHQLVREAEAYKFMRVASAEAQSAQFKGQMMAYNAAPEVYLNRAYLQPWMNSSTNARLYVVTSTNTHDVFQIDLQEKISVDMTDIPVPTPRR